MYILFLTNGSYGSGVSRDVPFNLVSINCEGNGIRAEGAHKPDGPLCSMPNPANDVISCRRVAI